MSTKEEEPCMHEPSEFSFEFQLFADHIAEGTAHLIIGQTQTWLVIKEKGAVRIYREVEVIEVSP